MVGAGKMRTRQFCSQPMRLSSWLPQASCSPVVKGCDQAIKEDLTGDGRLSLIRADEIRLGNEISAGCTFDVAARYTFRDTQLFNRQCH
jgi:hypothetical protein